MKWIKAKIFCAPEALETIGAVLMEQGITGFILNDPNNINELHGNNAAPWDYIDEELEVIDVENCNIEFYLNENTQGAQTLFHVKQSITSLKNNDIGINLGSLNIEVDDVDDEDWANSWKKYFKPLKVGDSFYIKPSWEKIEDSENRTIIEIDPANSFGTGAHATTQLCLKALEKQNLKEVNILDLGCGSGILGIGAGLSGTKNITFVDIDEHCITTSKQNVRDNELNIDDMKFYIGDVIQNKALREEIGLKKYHVIVANIMADIIIAMTPILKDFIKDDGTIIMSGIITERVEDVISALKEKEYNVISVDEQDGWTVIVAKI